MLVLVRCTCLGTGFAFVPPRPLAVMRGYSVLVGTIQSSVLSQSFVAQESLLPLPLAVDQSTSRRRALVRPAYACTCHPMLSTLSIYMWGGRHIQRSPMLFHVIVIWGVSVRQFAFCVTQVDDEDMIGLTRCALLSLSVWLWLGIQHMCAMFVHAIVRVVRSCTLPSEAW